jgi:hypothetical protein
MEFMSVRVLASDHRVQVNCQDRRTRRRYTASFEQNGFPLVSSLEELARFVEEQFSEFRFAENTMSFQLTLYGKTFSLEAPLILVQESMDLSTLTEEIRKLQLRIDKLEKADPYICLYARSGHNPIGISWKIPNLDIKFDSYSGYLRVNGYDIPLDNSRSVLERLQCLPNVDTLTVEFQLASSSGKISDMDALWRVISRSVGDMPLRQMTFKGFPYTGFPIYRCDFQDVEELNIESSTLESIGVENFPSLRKLDMKGHLDSAVISRVREQCRRKQIAFKYDVLSR